MNGRKIVSLAAIVGVGAGCNCSKSRTNLGPGQGQTSVVKDASSATLGPKFPFKCDAVGAGAQYALGSAASNDDEDDSGLDVPFGINVGQAVGYPGGFAVSAIDGRSGKSHAILGILGAHGENGRQLDLGRIFGDADPPRLAGDSRSLVVALADMDAAGRTLRLLRIDDIATTAKVTRGPDVSVSENPAAAFPIATNADRGIVVWEEPDKNTEKGQIVAASFTVQSLVIPKKLSTMSDRNADAESPQVISRPGGFWLAWVQSDTTSARDPQAKASRSTTGRGTQKSTAADDSTLPAVDLGTRELYAIAVDLAGRAIAKPLRITQGSAHVVAYDLTALVDGSALLAWRDDEMSPGIESQVVHLGRLGLDGHLETYRIEDESIGVGAPQLLVDSAAASGDRVWLAVGGDRTGIARLEPNGNPTSMIVGDADLGISNPLVRFENLLLVARQRGRAVDLEPLSCRFGDQ